MEANLGGRDAIGSEAIVRAGGRNFRAVLQPATSYFSSNDPVLHFGIGTASRIESVEVRWPDGSTESFPGCAADQLVVLQHKAAYPSK
jgi:hypothetical protein